MVEGTGFENQQWPKGQPEFKSLSLRHFLKNNDLILWYQVFFMCIASINLIFLMSTNMTKDDFFGGVSKPVNESLAKIFIKLGLIEQTGHGVSLIVDKYGKDVFAFLDNFLRVTIPFTYDLNSHINTNDVNGAENGAEKTIDELILEQIRNNPEITRSELARITGKGTTTIYRWLKKMQDLNKIVRVGSDKGGHWKIK